MMLAQILSSEARERRKFLLSMPFMVCLLAGLNHLHSNAYWLGVLSCIFHLFVLVSYYLRSNSASLPVELNEILCENPFALQLLESVNFFLLNFGFALWLMEV